MAASGTKRTKRAGLLMSVDRCRPEVVADHQPDAIDPQETFPPGLPHHSRQYCRDLLTPFSIQMKAVPGPRARLIFHRSIDSHRIDDFDAACPQLFLDCRNICSCVGGALVKFTSIIESINHQ